MTTKWRREPPWAVPTGGPRWPKDGLDAEQLYATIVWDGRVADSRDGLDVVAEEIWHVLPAGMRELHERLPWPAVFRPGRRGELGLLPLLDLRGRANDD